MLKLDAVTLALYWLLGSVRFELVCGPAVTYGGADWMGRWGSNWWFLSRARLW